MTLASPVSDRAWLIRPIGQGRQFAVSISTYAIAGDRTLSLIAPVAATSGAGPTDAAVSPDGRQLSVRMRAGSVASWRIGPSGSLTDAGTAAGTAFGISGLVAD
ncbi:hypothetical protein EKO23_20345 [Nocardioides guangzhouensis]|uniref:Lactonase family protein n=1 Tax=Nocardioides guangzhouensis TaxID=2497878 RepID=A0A4Q4Z5C1_9ACTN|nr:hypothetical protein [Nocardioides guangzhouensis]RYP82970.1 hypothetical protein EKO23_20345 [Nocardioides guangzhouensis]